MDSVKCDSCGADISCSTNSVDYRLRLMNVELPPCSNSVTDMMIHPPISRNCDFCGIGCLRKWVIQECEKQLTAQW